MKRSQINTILQEAIAFLAKRQFFLPPFAFWTPEDWPAKGPEVAEIVENQLGWDVTDFGLGDFEHSGLLLFTLRNGRVENLKAGRGKLYAEKVMIVREAQLTPLHFHWQKTEDIINRGGGNLLVRLYKASPDGAELLDTGVSVQTDGVRRVIEAGGTVVLLPGESITLETQVYHSFWGEPGRGAVLAGEVSVVNDDRRDNRFYEPLGRFPAIQEDEPPLHLLVGDYPDYYRR